jgi:hypothetical protein
MWGSYSNFASYLWPTEEDKSKADPDEYNKWSERPLFWYPPLDWVNFVDSRLFTSEYSLQKRYWTMFYYGVLILGSNEMGPVNEIEMAFIIFSLLSAAFLNALIFGDIATLTSVFSKGSTDY